MAAIALLETSLAALKKSLLDEFPDAKSSHVSEALASSLGFRTNAALKAAMTGPNRDRPFVVLNSKQFTARLQQLGACDEGDAEFDFELSLISQPVQGVVSTMPDSAYDIEYDATEGLAQPNGLRCQRRAGTEAVHTLAR